MSFSYFANIGSHLIFKSLFVCVLLKVTTVLHSNSLLWAECMLHGLKGLDMLQLVQLCLTM